MKNVNESHGDNIRGDSDDDIQVDLLHNMGHVYREVLKKINEGIILYTGDNSIVYANPVAINMLCRENNEMYGKNIHDFIDPGYRETFQRNSAMAACEGVDLDFLHSDGIKVPVRAVNSTMALDQDSLHLVSFSNMGEQAELKKTLRESGIKFRTLIEHSSEIIAVLDGDGNFEYCSESVMNMLGYSPYEIAGTTLFQYLHPDDANSLRDAYRERILKNDRNDLYHSELRLLDSRNNWRFVKTVFNTMLNDGLINGVLVNIRDVTDQRKAEKMANHLQFYDPLVTSLPNIGLLKNRLGVEIIKVKERSTDAIIAVITLDIDRFHNVNHLYGNNLGDLLLNKIGERLMNSFRDDDLVARFSGDIFVVLLSYVARAYDFMDIISKTKKIFAEPFYVNDAMISVTASFGLSIFPNDGDDADVLINNSSSAMHRAKKSGPGSYSLYDPVLQEEMTGSLQLEGELKKGLANDEFMLYYQPKYDGALNMAGAETLVRWSSVNRGIVYPGVFIPLLERSGMIVELGYRIMEMACRQCRAWEKRGAPVKISINISPVQFYDERLIPSIREIIGRTGVDPALLEFEITESAIMNNSGSLMGKLHEIRDMGIDIAMDDFGTGFSSLSNLMAYPIKTLKIDKSFVDKVPESHEGRVVVDMIISLAAKLGLNVVAEGIETEHQHVYLKENNCNIFQGYYYSRPVPAGEFEKIIFPE